MGKKIGEPERSLWIFEHNHSRWNVLAARRGDKSHGKNTLTCEKHVTPGR